LYLFKTKIENRFIFEMQVARYPFNELPSSQRNQRNQGQQFMSQQPSFKNADFH
jgi:hypothetical protein